MHRLDRMLTVARTQVPDLRLSCKADVPWMRALGVVMRLFNPTFCSTYTTVIGGTVYLPALPEDMPRDQLAQSLVHKLVHPMDMAAHGADFYLVGPAGPIGRTGRAYWEPHAYAVDLLVALEQGALASRAHSRGAGPLFSSSA